MKTPRVKELKRLNTTLKATRWIRYHRLLSVAIVQYSRKSGDRRLLGLLRSRRYDLLYREVDALSSQKYLDAASHFAAHQLAAIIKKYPWDPAVVKLDPERRALESFRASEHRCKWMNRWAIAAYRRKLDDTDFLLHRMKCWIRETLGASPDLASIYGYCDLTAGASIGVTGNATNLYRKLTAEKWSVSPSALPYFAAALTHQPHYATRVARGNGRQQSIHVSESDVMTSCDLVSYNKISFVAKTAKTHRSIAVEPLGNGFVQKGIDLLMRKFLKRRGIDLSDQSLNQRLAREGSVDDSEEGFCTIDLSSASDSVALGVVKLLLPPRWFRLLDSVRSPSYRLPSGEIQRYEKICSMGNGFCFPLESLIFAAAVHAVSGGQCGRDWAVYGDDIVVRKKFFLGVVSLLKRLGFKTNVQKTFADGPFRESCGSNWFNGEDVTPFTLDYELDSLDSLFKAINLCRRNERASMFFHRVPQLLIAEIPDSFRFFRPYDGPPDSAIDYKDLTFPKNWRWMKELQRPVWWELKVRPKSDEQIGPSFGWVVLAAALRGHPSERPFVIRRSVEMSVRSVVPRPKLQWSRKMSLDDGAHPDAPGLAG